MSPIKKTIKKTKKPRVEKKNVNNPFNLSVYLLTGEVTKTIELPKEMFGVKANPILLAQYIHVYQTNQRQGNASTKTRGEVTGSTRKIYRQKGTGRARHGSIKAPIFVGGGVVGGPKPHDYSLRINKKQKRQALFLSLSSKLHDKSIFGLSYSEDSTKPSTKTVVNFMKKLNISGKNTMFVLPKIEKNNFVLSARNIRGVTMIEAKSLNAFELLQAQTVVIADEALVIMQKHFLQT